MRRRQIGHDLRHEVSTLMLLASLLAEADDVGRQSRHRARQIQCEGRWLRRLLEEYERTQSDQDGFGPAMLEPIRLDLSAAEAVEAVQLCGGTSVHLSATEAWARVDRLAFWRMLRNIIDNAVRAAGPGGRVEVRVGTVNTWAVAQVDDDGPGFGGGQPGIASLGLGIAKELVASHGGELKVHRRQRVGCRVRVRLPSAAPGHRDGRGADRAL
jgi:signal transduction histidine kinase